MFGFGRNKRKTPETPPDQWADIDAILDAMPPDENELAATQHSQASPAPNTTTQAPLTPTNIPYNQRTPRVSGPYTYSCQPEDDLRYDNFRLGFIDPFRVNYTKNEGWYMPLDGSFVIPLTAEDHIRMTAEDHRQFEFRCKILPLCIEARQEMEAIVLQEFGTTYFGFTGSTLTPEVREAGLKRSRELFNQFMSDKTTGLMFSHAMAGMMIREEERHQEVLEAINRRRDTSPMSVATNLINEHPFLTGFFGVDVVRKIFGK